MAQYGVQSLLELIGTGPLLKQIGMGPSTPQTPSAYQTRPGTDAFSPVQTTRLGDFDDMDMIFGTTPPSLVRVPQYTRSQESALDRLLNAYLQQSEQTPDFAPIEQQARTDFEQKTLPALMQRLNTFGGAGSSGAQQLIGSAGAGLEQNLAAMRQQARETLLQRLLQGASIGLQPRYTDMIQPPEETGLSKIISVGLPIAGAALGAKFGGLKGAELGAGVGSAAGSLVKRR